MRGSFLLGPLEKGTNQNGVEGPNTLYQIYVAKQKSGPNSCWTVPPELAITLVPPAKNETKLEVSGSV